MIRITEKEDYDGRMKLAVGALLHDIGKLVQRADMKPSSMTHSEFGSRWLGKWELLRPFQDFAGLHHDPEEYRSIPLFALLRLADWISAGERFREEVEEESGRWDHEARLQCIFSRVSLDGRRKLKEPYYYQIAEAGELLYPQERKEVRGEEAQGLYAMLLQGIEKDLLDLTSRKELSVNNLFFLLEKYTSFVPSYMRIARDPWRDPDVSLFDHSRMTAAIALCLHDHCRERLGGKLCDWPTEFILAGTSGDAPDGSEGLMGEEAFILADVDLSGIQAFIYDIASKKAARSLRGRSFYVEMLVEDICEEITRRLDLERFNIIFSGGGRARLLLPNTERCREVLREVEREANHFLDHNTEGALSVNISHLPLRGVDMIATGSGSPLTRVITELAAVKEKRKHERSSEYLAEEELDPGPFEPGLYECSICHRETDHVLPVADEQDTTGRSFEVCPLCKSLVDLGGVLKGCRAVYFHDKKESGLGVGCAELPFSLLSWDSGNEDRCKLALLLENRWDAKEHRGPQYAGFAYPRYRAGKEVSDFEELAKESLGEDLIGVLRMDVDDLGAVFGRGIASGEYSFTRYAVLSRMMNRFFRENLPEVISGRRYRGFFDMLPGDDETRRKRALEIIYAGGDDLFIVGSWNDVLDAAFDISTAFRDFTGQNPDLHISGGMVLQRHDFPIYFLAGLSGEEEERAKAREGKNSFSVHGRAAPWKDYLRMKEAVIRPLLELGKDEGGPLVRPQQGDGAAYTVPLLLPRAFIRRLMKVYGEALWGMSGNGRGGKLKLPVLCYLLARAEERYTKVLRIGDEDRWRREWEVVMETLMDTVTDREWMGLVYNGLSWLDLMSRGG